VGGFDGEASLADAAGADQGEQAAGRVGQQVGDLSEFIVSADEGCQLWR
jgi:hypothetical protein